jgi:ABC-type glycerol-3-phosphate transport system permease component
LLIVPLFRQILAFDPVDTYRGIILPQAFAPAMVLILKVSSTIPVAQMGSRRRRTWPPRSSPRCR